MEQSQFGTSPPQMLLNWASSCGGRDERLLCPPPFRLRGAAGRPAGNAHRQYASIRMPDGNTEQYRSFNDLMRVATTPANAANLLRTNFRFDVREAATQVRCPTMVFHAREDSAIPFDEGRSLAALIPNARFVPLESRNHLLIEGEPAWEQFVQQLDNFLPAAPPKKSSAADRLPDGFTGREHEILDLVAQGLNNGTIATKLGISERTVRNNVSIILSKLDVHSRAEAIVRAREAGLGQKKT